MFCPLGNFLRSSRHTVVCTMNVAAFTNLFAGYQNSISLVYEISSATALVSMFSTWSHLSIDLAEHVDSVSMVRILLHEVQKESVTAAGILAIAMLCVHYRGMFIRACFELLAAYITAHKKQKEEKRNLCAACECCNWQLLMDIRLGEREKVKVRGFTWRRCHGVLLQVRSIWRILAEKT